MNQKEQRNNKSKFLKFSALGIQMAVTIAGFTWLGTFLDTKCKTKTPWWTITLSLFGVTAGLTLAIREVIKMGKDEE